jgi:Heterokaryon incompatibility protein (HET)
MLQEQFQWLSRAYLNAKTNIEAPGGRLLLPNARLQQLSAVACRHPQVWNFCVNGTRRLSPTGMSYFIYRSLTPHKRRIRLIHVLPASEPSMPITCTISHVSLDNTPAYIALSYNWGGTTRQREILINGAIFSVSEKLEVALRHLRLQHEPLTLWIDALCIDQDDDVEKSKQLEQMRQIYSQALSVVAWLGPATDNSDVAMQWIQQYGGRSFDLGIGTKPEKQLCRLLESLDARRKDLIDEELERFIEDLKVQLSPANPEHTYVITALLKLLKRPYWSRIWVVQELASASKVLFVCGKRMVEEDPLHHALRLLRNFRLYQLLKWGQDTPIRHSEGVSIISIDTHNPIILLKIRRAAEPSPLIYLMRSLRHFQATDPRDKVFALLGIASDTKTLGLRPDYRKSCEEVYTDLARALIQNGYIELLSLCEFPKERPVLPSWVPDWSRESYRSPLQQRSLDRSTRPRTTILEPRFSASGINYTIGLNSGHTIGCNMPLLLPARFLGEVRQLGMSWEHEAVGRWLHDLHSLSHLMSDAFKLSSGRAQAVWRTAVADQEIRQGIKKPRLSEERIRTVNDALKNKDLALVDEQTFIGVGLGDYCQQLQLIAQGRRPLLASGGFLGIGPRETEPGDLVFILLGADVPYILRQQSQDDKLRLIGEAYVHGIMDGEAMEGDPAIETIALC